MIAEEITFITQFGFAAFAFYLMFKFASDTTEKLRDAIMANTESNHEIIKVIQKCNRA